METRANYILIGAFTLAGLLGILAFFLWFARLELDRQFAYYDINFSSVSGLSAASDVRFSGLPVGQVVDVGLSPDGDGTIRVRVEIGADTPVRADSVATIEAQGVTGVSFVGISPGTPEAELMVASRGGDVPVIEAGRSALQSLTEDAPQILEETLTVVQGLGGLLGEENQNRVDRILTNMEDASGNFAVALEDFSTVTASVSDFATQIDSFNATLEELTGAMTTVLETADDTLASIGILAEDSRGTLAVVIDTMSDTQGLLLEAERYIATDLTATTEDTSRVVNELGAQIGLISADMRLLLETFTTTGTTATARLSEAETTLAAADTLIARLDGTLDDISRAASSVDTLVAGDGTALIAEARQTLIQANAAIASIGAVAQDDLPLIMADIRAATATARRVMQEVGEDLSIASGRIDALSSDAGVALAQVTDTFANANTTLSAINGALETGDAALASAARAFDGADRLINEDGTALVADLRGTVAELDAAVALVAADVPLISADLQAASAAAETAFATLNQLVAGASGPFDAFATTGLPNYTRLATETRVLIDNLDALTTQIQRDPARFFLNQQTPDFRR